MTGMEEKINPEEEIAARLIITLMRDGSVKVEGPVFNSLLAYGLLQSARDAIFEEHQRQSKSNIVKPNGIMNFARGGLKK